MKIEYKKLFHTLFFIMTFHLSLYASCLVDHEDAFIVNEINTHGNWIELYANPDNIQSPVSNWKATVCTTDKCETLAFSFDIATNPDGFFYVIDFDALFGGNDWNGKSLDVRIQDDAGNEVNYFNLGLKKGNTNTSLSVPAEVLACGIYDVSCDYFYRTNSSESNFYRDPDGGCGMTETTPWNDNTESGSNNPEPFVPKEFSISDVSVFEGDSGTTQFVFDVIIDPIWIFPNPYIWGDIYITYSIVDGTATVADNDYTPISNGVITIPAWQTSTTITVDVIGDLNVEVDETFFVRLEAATIGTFSDAEGIGTIVNDDGGGPVPSPGVYNAIDFNGVCNAQTNWNDNIKTKIVNETFDFSILAKEDTTDLPLEANITKVTLKYYPDGDNSVCSGVSSSQVDLCTNCGVTDTEGCLTVNIPDVINNQAAKCVEVVIEGKDKDDTAGTTLSTSSATDNFSTRPNTYDCTFIPPSVLISEHLYTGDFIATPLNLASATAGYTTSSVVLSANKYMRTGDLNATMSGVITPASVSFVDGNASGANFNFNDVGDIGIDLNDSTWANVDSDDTVEAERVIHAECRRLFRPDHFLVQVTRPFLENNSTDFTYLSNLTSSVTMSAWARDLNVTITAQGEANATMLNYSYPITLMYANVVTLSPSLSLPVKHSVATKRVDLVDENSSDIIGFTFVSGVATYSYEDVQFNYDRSYNTPISPFMVDGSETYFSINVQDNTYPSVAGDDNTSSDANATFYFGRLNPSDITTTLLPATNPIPLEVYDDTGSVYTSGMKQNSLFWYINDLHSGNSAGYAFEAVASSDTLIDNALAGFTFNYNSVVSGEQDLDITAASTQKGTIHLKTQEWLWYVPSGFGSAYDDGAGTDCTMHPCFKFSLIPNNSVLKIESGDFNGTVIPDVNRSDYIQKGVKLFR